MRTLIWFVYFWITLVAMVPFMLYAWYLNRSGQLKRRDAFVARMVTGWMGSLLKLAGVKVEVCGLEHIPKHPVVFVSNHQGNFDIPILLRHLDRPHGLVAKVELQKLPFVRIWMRYLGCVFLDRENLRKSAAALNEAAKNLQDGYSMIIFPEGTRSRGDTVGEFKSGAFKIAYKTGTPIVPIRIDGSYRAMEANQGLRITPAKVRLQVLPPVEVTGLTKEQLRQLEQEIRQQIIRAQKTA